MKVLFHGKTLVRPGGQARVWDLAGEEAVKVESSEAALLACLKGHLELVRWQKEVPLEAGEVVRLKPGAYRIRGEGRAMLVLFGLSREALEREHEAFFALLEALPAREAAEALARLFEAHAAKEETLYYPTLSPGARRERVLEHRLLRELIGELLKALREGRGTEGIIDRLRTALEAHAEKELAD